MRRIILVVVLLATGVSLLLGCGSSSEAEAPSITKKQFVRRAQAFCNKAYRAEEVALKAYAGKHLLLFGGGEPWEQEVLNEIAFEYVEDKIDFFKSLPVPEGDGREVRGMIEAFEKGLSHSKENPAAFAEQRIHSDKVLPRPWDASYETTRAYGPWLCGQP